MPMSADTAMSGLLTLVGLPLPGLPPLPPLLPPFDMIGTEPDETPQTNNGISGAPGIHDH